MKQVPVPVFGQRKELELKVSIVKQCQDKRENHQEQASIT